MTSPQRDAASSTAALTIDRAVPEDAEVLMELVREIAAHQDQLEHVSVTARRWTELLARPEVVVLLARVGGAPAGYVSAVRRLHLWSGRDVLALDDLFVREWARGCGVGASLMSALAVTHAAPEGLTVTWGMEPNNEGAIRFYRRLGATLRPKVVAAWRPSAFPPHPSAREGLGGRRGN